MNYARSFSPAQMRPWRVCQVREQCGQRDRAAACPYLVCPAAAADQAAQTQPHRVLLSINGPMRLRHPAW